ncbi:MAG: IS66 family insertion sequence element accessory protein TnpB, partial [Candidatus Korobacteraceae bacterium]
MITLPMKTHIWIAAGVTDMRRGFDGLSALVQTKLEQSPFSGHVFVFRGRRGDLIKVLWRAAEDPHPPQLSAHFPAGFIRSHAGTGANLFHQLFLSRLGLPRHTRQGLAQSAPAHAQAEGFFHHRRSLAIRQTHP